MHTIRDFSFLKTLATFLLAACATTFTATASSPLDIRDFGAVGDGTTLNTAAIQAAIDKCSETRAPGVRISGGSYVTGTIYLKSHVTLQVAAGAELLGSTDIKDYSTDTHSIQYKKESHMDRCLIFAKNAKHIGIEGAGVIDARGTVENFPNTRPMLLRLLECKSIRMRDITLRNPAAWTSAWLYCDDIAIDGITIQSRANKNGDGLDFDGCTGVRVNNSAFDTSDDSICLQTSRPDRPCRDITVSNCIFISKWAGIRIGLLSRGDFSNVTVTNCIFRDIEDSGLKIQMCEGAEMKNMIFSNLIMENVPRPVFMTFGQQRVHKDAPKEVAPMKAMHSMMFSNLLIDNTACDKNSAFIFVGLPGHPIENITLDNIRLKTGGGGTAEDAYPRTLPDLTLEPLKGHWPEYSCFGRTVPAHGIYAGHVDGLTVRNTVLDTIAGDARPAIICDDVSGLELSNLQINASESTEPLVFLNKVRRDSISNVRSTGAARETVRRAETR